MSARRAMGKIDGKDLKIGDKIKVSTTTKETTGSYRQPNHK